MINTVKQTLLLGFAVVAVQACSNSAVVNVVEDDAATAKTEKASKMAHNAQYAKPGAAVNIGHSYDGHTDVGEIENIQISITEQYSSGLLSVSVNSGDGLTLSTTANPINFSMNGEEDKTFDISVSAQAAGRYYVNFQAYADTGNGQKIPRIQSMEINVGKEADYAKEKNPLKVEDSEGGKVIVMDAEETIQ